MKVPLTVIVLAATAFLNVAHAQIVAMPESTNSWLLHESPNLSLTQPWTHLPTNTLPFLSLTNGSTAPPDMSSPASKLPQPGIYESYPYACIIDVPGPTEWNQFKHSSTETNGLVEHGSSATMTMPIYNPGLTLVPLSEAEK